MQGEGECDEKIILSLIVTVSISQPVNSEFELVELVAAQGGYTKEVVLSVLGRIQVCSFQTLLSTKRTACLMLN